MKVNILELFVSQDKFFDKQTISFIYALGTYFTPTKQKLNAYFFIYISAHDSLTTQNRLLPRT